MNEEFQRFLTNILDRLQESGLYKAESVITTPQQSLIKTSAGSVLNFCANNYLGFANHPDIIHAAKLGLTEYGYGMSSVRFISGTQSVHKALERKLSEFLKMEDTLLYGSCFDANTGLFEALLGAEDVILSDALNHASIIDGIKLCKAKCFRYQNNDMEDLENQLKNAKDARFRLIVTDGVFSMEGSYANLPKICELADQYHALVMVDDSHAVGFIGEHGGGTPEHFGVQHRIDIITGTLGKALGGAQGGYTAGKKGIIELLRQRSRPYLFSNSLAPMIAAASLKALDLLKDTRKRDQLLQQALFFREKLTALGFSVIPGTHPIIPVMINDEKLSIRMAEKLLLEGIYVVSFSYPVVPTHKARIRIQLSVDHTPDQLEQALAAFQKVGKALGVIS